jgi:hypothetical protein
MFAMNTTSISPRRLRPGFRALIAYSICVLVAATLAIMLTPAAHAAAAPATLGDSTTRSASAAATTSTISPALTCASWCTTFSGDRSGGGTLVGFG